MVERSSHRRKTLQGKRIDAAGRIDRSMGQSRLLHIFFHPDYTVGPGITPDLLTSPDDT
jgi:hypothetical protein